MNESNTHTDTLTHRETDEAIVIGEITDLPKNVINVKATKKTKVMKSCS